MSTLAIIATAGTLVFTMCAVTALALCRMAAQADEDLQRVMERPVFIGSGFLDVGAVFEWPERDD